MKLHEDKKLFRQAVRYAADKMQIPAVYVEKDYWVTYALSAIFKSEAGKDVVFKGGTALSKCFQLIDRFSEDIDLVVLRRDGESDARMKTKLKNVSNAIEPVLPEIEIEDITRKRGMNRKTAHQYSKEFDGNFGQVRDVIVLETTWLGYYEPYTTSSIVSFVGQMMLDNKQTEIAEKYGLHPFDLLVLEPTRTVCEKIMSLVRFSYSKNPIEDLKKKIRHTYDLHQLLKQKEFAKFFKSAAFEKMLLKVANDDVVSFKNSNGWLAYHPNDAKFFAELVQVWGELKTVYSSDFKKLVYGSFPDEAEVYQTLKQIKERMSTIQWPINIQA